MKTQKLLVSALAAICLLTGCASNPMAAVYDNNAKIASHTNSYNLTNFEQAAENGRFTASAEKMEGMDTIWVFDAKEDAALDISYTLNVSSGRLKLVLINPKGRVSTIAECDTETAAPIQSTLHVESGNNRIKLVAGENTKFDIDLSIPEGEFQKLG